VRRAAAALALLLAGCSFLPDEAVPLPRALLDTRVSLVRALAFSPDGVLFASAGGGEEADSEEIALWDVATGIRKMVFAKRPGRVASLAFAPDSKSLAVGEAEGQIRMLDVGTGAERTAFSGLGDRVSCLAFSFDGKYLISVVDGDPYVEVRRWDVKTGESRDLFAPAAAPPVALSSDGSALALPSPGDPAGIRVVDLESRKVRVLSRIGLVPGDTLMFTPEGKSIAAVHVEDWSPIPNHCPYLYLIDVASGKIQLRSPRPFGATRGLAVSHDGKLLAHGVGAGLQLWDLEHREVRVVVGSFPAGSEGAALLVFSPDDRTLVSTDGRSHILFWDVPHLLERSTK
jgi:WD40 repeat protein